ncbi:MAG: GIY-YIG nuclease family protein [Marinosulfonomonas sp.]|nr:GIY-YIG nuclease family protein [Marinosulfonomonas sp.]
MKKTGISERDWKGIYWARWGDALKEAGFEPNKLSKKYSADHLLMKYCEATRHYKRAPTKPELRMYSKQVEEFPSYTTMQKHFGTIGNMRVKAHDWAEENPDFEDVINFLPKEIEHKDSPPINTVNDGWVYLLESGKHYKIGRGEDLERRVKQVTVAMPEKVGLVHAIKTDDPSGIEAYWHRRFKDKRANGEWFALDLSDVRAFKRRKFQ